MTTLSDGQGGHQLAALRPRHLLATVALVIAVAIGCALRPGAEVENQPPEAPIPGINPLTAGSQIPSLEAGGWVNGPPPTLGPGRPRVIVVDVFALW